MFPDLIPNGLRMSYMTCKYFLRSSLQWQCEAEGGEEGVCGSPDSVRMCGGYLRGEAQVVEGKSEEEIALEREAAEAIMRGQWGGGS